MTPALLAAFSLAGCGWQDRVAPIELASELVVAVRVTPISYTVEADARSMAFEQALVEKLAASLDRSLRFIPVRSDQEVIDLLLEGKAHLGAGWLTPTSDPRLTSTPPFHFDDVVLVQNEAWLPVEELDQLSSKTLHLPKGSRLLKPLTDLRSNRIPSLTLIERRDDKGMTVLQAVADQQVEFTAAPRQQFLAAQNHFPELQSGTILYPLQPIVWLMNNVSNPVRDRINNFVTAAHTNGLLTQMKDLHFSFLHRLTKLDASTFIARTDSRLPRYEEVFRQAQISTGIDWRLLAALAYQESQWDPLATSPTGVRGMMMLTEETADRLRVTNRLDADQSIRAGSRYVAMLRDELPPEVREPDRTWLALAAYNLGMGHLNGGRAIARGRQINPNSWFEMKKILPLLARPEIYERLKSGRARGGEAVILVENVRAYYDILQRLREPFEPLPDPEPELNTTQETLRRLRAEARPENLFRP